MLQGAVPVGELIVRAALGALLIAVAVHDIRSLRIPNALPLTIVAIFAVSCAAGLYRPVAPHLVSFFVAAGIGAALFFTRAWGGGDAKLVAALALFLEPSTLPFFALAVGLAGGIVAMGLMIANARRAAAARITLMPYGVALAAGGLITIVGAPS